MAGVGIFVQSALATLLHCLHDVSSPSLYLLIPDLRPLGLMTQGRVSNFGVPSNGSLLATALAMQLLRPLKQGCAH